MNSEEHQKEKSDFSFFNSAPSISTALPNPPQVFHCPSAWLNPNFQTNTSSISNSNQNQPIANQTMSWNSFFSDNNQNKFPFLTSQNTHQQQQHIQQHNQHSHNQQSHNQPQNVPQFGYFGPMNSLQNLSLLQSQVEKQFEELDQIQSLHAAVKKLDMQKDENIKQQQQKPIELLSSEEQSRSKFAKYFLSLLELHSENQNVCEMISFLAVSMESSLELYGNGFTESQKKALIKYAELLKKISIGNKK